MVNAQNLFLNGDFEKGGETQQTFANGTHSPTYSNIVKETSPKKATGLSFVRLANKKQVAYLTSDVITVEPEKTYR